ncbi:hypothetical protein [Salinibacter phage M8CC-19]|uniref:DUF1320 domain-containing protein n=2 Tax=Kryptosalinivirus M8CC19 TaxID=2560720 RepID=A0A2I6UGE1_9CAUD|nr:hypothetical protein FGG63_gp16 [Salinibacter phage M8CC-19]AUO78977.1 hypothetical protein [Salinibacter phage M8CC-19]AUO79211.1 hypothetical protein [Salinibacter phage M31CC-1]
MPTLNYAKAEDIQRVLTKNQLTRLLPGEYNTETIDFSNVPSDPFSDPVWSYVALAILAAQGEVNSLLNRRYKIPIIRDDGEVPEILKVHVLTIAKFRIYQRAPSQVPEYVMKEYNEAKSSLRRIARGDMSIHGVDDVERRVISFGKTESGDFNSTDYPL